MSHLPLPVRQQLIDRTDASLSLTQQSQLLDLSRSSLYYRPVIDQEDIVAINALDEIYTKYPFYGSRRMRYELKTAYGISICREHIQRLMRIMGLQAIYPKQGKNLSQPNQQHQTYPYLLKNIAAQYPNHIWGTDITYVKLEKGFAYLVAIIDWFSRYVIAWQLSENLEMSFCTENLERALQTAAPDIHNSDQGSHFTSPRYVKILTEKSIKISMDGRGRCMDNIFTERLWRTVKYENVYLKSYTNAYEAKKGLADYFTFYNTKRPHQSLNNHTPEVVYCQRIQS